MSDCASKFNYYCYVCGKFTIMPSRKRINDHTARIYEQYFNVTMIRDVNWVPTIACSTCTNRLNDWSNGKVESMTFGVPVIWTDPGNHDPDNCYVCANPASGINRSKTRKLEYKGVKSATRPIPHSDVVPVPTRPSLTEEYIPPTFDSMLEASTSEYQPSIVQRTCNHIEISQHRLNVMARQLKLSQTRQIILAQHLNAVNILAPDVRIFGAYGRQQNWMEYFERNAENTFAFCNNIRGLMEKMGHQYAPNEWRLFIDSSKSSLKAVLLYIDNTKNPVPLALGTDTRENHESMKKILDKIKYDDHLWKICADLKVISILCGLQLGYTKNMCYLCLWNTRYSGNQYLKRDWPARQYIRIGQDNVLKEPLVPMEKVLLPPLHIKLGLVKKFIKSLISRGNQRAVCRLETIFPRLSKAKIKEGTIGDFYFY